MGRWRERRRSSFRALGRSRSLANGINVRPSHGGGIARAMSPATVAALLFLSGVAQPPTDLASESQTETESQRVDDHSAPPEPPYVVPAPGTPPHPSLAAPATSDDETTAVMPSAPHHIVVPDRGHDPTPAERPVGT